MSIVYLCGPINGCSDQECKDWREYVKTKLPETIDPMRNDYRGKEDESYKDIVETDKSDIDKSKIILVNYDKPSVGTSMEVLYAWEKFKKVYVVCKSDTKISPWLRYHADRFFHSFDDAIKYILEGV